MALKASKPVTPKHVPNSDLKEVMELFTKMINRCIRIGLRGASTT